MAVVSDLACGFEPLLAELAARSSQRDGASLMILYAE
jgi:hypothetical protein